MKLTKVVNKNEGGVNLLKKLIALSALSLLLFGCGGDFDSSESERAIYDYAATEEYSDAEAQMEMAIEEDFIPPEDTAPDREQLEEATRRIIYNAYLDLEVKQYLEVTQNIEEKVFDMNGYVVSNQTSRYDDDLHQGTIEIRIPQERLDEFFNYLEKHDQISIQHREITGEDVTDQYVDLETRLASREQLEERLMTFMEEAETTEDLLNISRDLANVQYEIERLKGQMNYIENRSDLATVELYIYEQETEFAHDRDLNVWERTKEQWLTSYNNIIVFGANLFVFVVGNLPVLILIVLIIGFIIWRVRRRKVRDNDVEQS